MGLAHWDDIERHHRAMGELDVEWQFLGRAAGTQTVGVNRMRVAPGGLSTPPHSHGASEELFYVLDGSGLAWQDEQVHELRPRDCVIHRANEHEHTLIGGPDGLDVIVFGTNFPTELGWLPRSNAVRFGWPWVEGRTDDPWEIEAQAPPLAHGKPAPRPANIVNVDEVDQVTRRDTATSSLATRELSDQAGLHWERIAPGRHGSVPHCHSEDEEVFVILEGEGTLELWPAPVPLSQGRERENVPIRAGHLIARPPATRIAHAFQAGPGGLTMLVYGTRRPNDACWYPRSSKIFWRGLGVIGRIESLDYWDGEGDPPTRGG